MLSPSPSQDEYEYNKREADALLHKLGYRLRSTLVFGYPPCPSCCLPPLHPAREEEGAIARGAVGRRFLRTTVIDGTLPTSTFRALRCAFRPTSRYWSEFYHHQRGNSKSTNDQDDDDNDDDEGATSRRKRRRTTKNNNNPSSFASHNISLPADDNAALPDQLLWRSKSLLEQVSLLVRRRLARRFPDIVDSTSVEIWCHRRPWNREHRLHYDMDEIFLWERRMRRMEGKRRRSGVRSYYTTSLSTRVLALMVKRTSSKSVEQKQRLLGSVGVRDPIAHLTLSYPKGETL